MPILLNLLGSLINSAINMESTRGPKTVLRPALPAANSEGRRSKLSCPEEGTAPVNASTSPSKTYPSPDDRAAASSIKRFLASARPVFAPPNSRTPSAFWTSASLNALSIAVPNPFFTPAETPSWAACLSPDFSLNDAVGKLWSSASCDVKLLPFNRRCISGSSSPDCCCIAACSPFLAAGVRLP